MNFVLLSFRVMLFFASCYFALIMFIVGVFALSNIELENIKEDVKIAIICILLSIILAFCSYLQYQGLQKINDMMCAEQLEELQQQKELIDQKMFKQWKTLTKIEEFSEAGVLSEEECVQLIQDYKKTKEEQKEIELKIKRLQKSNILTY